MEPRLEDLVELYAAATRIEADRLALLLEEEEIESLVRETTMSSFPSPAEGHFLLLVRSGDKARARTLIEAAVRDGAVSSGGRLFD